MSRAALNSSATVNVLGDTYIRSGSPNQNAGGDTVVRLQQSGKNRGLLFFDTNAIRQAVTPGSLVTATLELTIDSNGNNWGTTGRTIALHRLKKASAEYSATWNCAIDSSVANSTADCSGATAWNMDSTDPNVQPWLSPEIGTSNITNNQTGVVSFNVTADIAAILDNSWAGYGFLLKKVDEAAAGSIDFKSKERGVPPRLVLEVQPPAAGSGGGGPMDAGVQRATITAAADNHVRQGEPNQNFGSSSMLRIQASGRNRAIFNFNPAEIHAALGTNGLVRATLELTITQTFNNWGPDRALGAHRMRGAWSELGSTWNCGVDSNTGNSSADCSGANAWYMWRPDLPDEQEAWVNPPESTALVQSGQTGIVSFDVTQSIACYLAGHTPLNGVMVKKEMENQAGHVEFASRETATPPVLVLEYNSGGGVSVTYTQCTGLLPDGGVADGGVDAGTCTPSATTDVTCDNVDDDCDKQKDEDYAVTSTTCGQGACGATGEQECVNGAVQDTCTAGSANGSDSDCDGIDQDCDGRTDEAYLSTPTNCGIGACLRNGNSVCLAGVVQNGCTPGTPAADDSSCDAVDDNCNGSIDEGYAPVATSCGIGACVRSGSTSCVTGTVQNNCSPGTPAPSDATCDDVDDNCNGIADEGYVSLVTSCGVGACTRAGATSCVGGTVLDSCAAGAGAADDATCDGVDDDCSGTADEDYVSLATNCGIGACASTGTTSCVAGAVQDSCAAGTAAANDTTCDGIDDDCSGAADEDYVPQATHCGVGACAGSGTTSCSAGSVHDSCVTGMTEPDDSCDLIDQDCDGKIDEGCESDCSDALDNDDDGPADCADGDCHDAAECTIGRTCTADSECTAMSVTGTPGKCLSLFPGGYCTRDCVPEAEPSTCPVGSFCSAATGTCVLHCDAHDACSEQRLECSDLDSLGDTDLLCRPTCETGTCRSGMYCDPSDNLCLACTTTDTSCDRVDQDCDGNIDDDVAPQPTSCGVGACDRSGQRTCVNGQMHDSCSPGSPAATDATCDGIDDDCSGAVDEDYVPVPTSCGSGACERAGLIVCTAGAAMNTCVPGAPAADDATCDGIDDDCDQRIDENYTSVPTSCGVGACEATGTSSCVGGSVRPNCVPGAAGNDTTCNGIDEDCDGHVDEQYLLQSTSCGIGACAATGTTSCVSGQVQSTCTPGTPSADTDCDNIDDDCDGHVDEASGKDDGNPCTDDSCDPVTGAVTHTPLAQGTSCSDGNVCNGAETCLSNSANCVAPSTLNIAAWWPGDGNTTDVLRDNDGIPLGGLAYAPAEVDQGFSFDGVDDAVDVSAHAAALNLAGQATIEMWVAVPSDTCRTLFQLKQDATHYQLLQVGANCTSLISGELVTWLYVNGTNSTAQGFQATAAQRPILIGTLLHHLALTFDGAGNTRIYIDGVNRTIVQNGFDRGIWGNFANPAIATIGAQPGVDNFVGKIDELTIYNRVLSASEISAIRNAGPAGKCKSSGPTCKAGTPLTINDGNPCTTDACDPATGVSHVAEPFGTPCNDSNACTQSDACDSAGACAGTPVNVDDGNACTDDSCSPTLGVTHQAVDVNDNNDCTNDSCDPSTGVHHAPVSPGTACTDHQGCTTGDVCNASGVCLGTAVDTSDGNPCTDDFCNSGDGVTYTISHFPKGNGASCSDGNVCTDPDYCRTVSGSCTSQPSGAVALWPADGYATDVIGAKHGVLGGGATYGFDGWNRAFALNGTDAFVNVDASAQAMNVSAPATIEFWARPTTDTCNTVFHLRQDATHEQKLQIGNGCTSSLTNEWVTWTYVNGAVTSTVGYTPSSHPVFSTLHYALTFNGTSTTFYVDGVQVSTTVGSGTGQGKWGGFSSPLSATLGAVRTSGVGSAFFNGAIDDLAVYNRVLSASEIAAIKAAGPKCWLPLCDSGDQVSNIDDGDTCTVDSCDPVTGIHHAPAIGVSCDDGNRCTAGDACNAQSLCSGHPADFCANIGRACTQDSDCGADVPGGICLTEAETGIPGGMCSLACTGTLACPSTASCNGLLMNAPVVRGGVTINSACFPRCTTNANCTRANGTCDSEWGVCTVSCTSNAACGAGYYCLSPYCLPAQSHETTCADGLDEDADGATDCADSDCFGNANCGEICTNNVNDDADGLADCLDTECPHECEICYSGQPGYIAGIDDDHDGLADCLDPDCQAIGTLCQEGAPFHCSDNVDNDLDGKTDCEDTDCLGFTDCHECPLCNGACSDGKDNDADGLSDCQDPDCGTLAACAENTEARCSDGLDNDADGYVDCTDPDCSVANGVVRCTEGGDHDLNCGDHLDNDLDGLVDCLDPSCRCFERCDDGIDNDGNGAADCADLFHCLHDAACVENCTDGIDNNGVFGIDCHDPNCDGNPSCVELDCNNGVDDEDDGKSDCADPDCTDSPDCPETCDNGVDDDANQRTDCADPECAPLHRCTEGSHCTDGIDNDADNRTDCADTDCFASPVCLEAAHCHDGVDNDRDGIIDCNDSDCAGAAPCIAEICGDMVDDDGDGMFDCADPDCVNFAGCDAPAPRLSEVAPPNDSTASTTLFDSMAFVYSGPSPIQYFVGSTTIVRQRAAVVRGHVRQRGGSSMPGVRISVLAHTELGETRTDADGSFTMVVNGGGSLTFKYELNGFVAAQRTADVGWGEWAQLPDVAMTPFDSEVTAIDTSGIAAQIQVARGSAVTDEDGTRRATLVVPAGTGASMTLSNGSTVPLPNISFRATELTVGADGLDAMPAHLPANTAYTYAVELSADEALAASATSVSFSSPVALYVENFIAAPVGTAVPTGFYDRQGGVWVAMPNGRVLSILAVADGAAVLDVNGTGEAATLADLVELGITNEELRALAQLYLPNQQLWRVPIEHFTPIDLNWAWTISDDALPPPVPLRRPSDGTKPDCHEETVLGSVVSCYSQSLGEDIPISGAPFALHYESTRAQGSVAQRRFAVQVTGPEVPSSFRSATLAIDLLGRHFEQHFDGTPSQRYEFEFDGNDAAGRRVFGTQTATVQLCHRYPAVYQPVIFQRNAALGRVWGQDARQNGAGLQIGPVRLGSIQYDVCRKWLEHVELNSAAAIGAWDLSIHHSYDPAQERVFLGDGSRQSAQLFDATTRVAGNDKFCQPPDNNLLFDCGIGEVPSAPHVLRVGEPADMALAPDGSLYILDYQVHDPYVAVLQPDGSSRHVLGWMNTTLDNFTKPANQFRFVAIGDIAIGPDNMIYVLGAPSGGCTGTAYIYRFSPDGYVVQRFAGTMDCSSLSSADGIPALDAQLFDPRGLAFGPDGALYFAEPGRVRRIGSDGLISTIAGVSAPNPEADPNNQGVGFVDGPASTPIAATSVDFGDRIQDIAVADDGRVHVVTRGYQYGTVFRIAPDGSIKILAGGRPLGMQPPEDSSAPAYAAITTDRVALASDGGVIVLGLRTLSAPATVHRIYNGTVVKLASGTRMVPYQEGQSARTVLVDPESIGVQPDRKVLLGDRGHILALKPNPMPAGPGLVPAPDGRTVWQFDFRGRHLRTIDSFTNSTEYEFTYSNAGELTSVVDANGNVFGFDRSNANAVRIVPPFAPPTTVGLDDQGLLHTVTSPDGGTYTASYHSGTKLLATFENPEHQGSTFSYDVGGRLRRDEDAAGGFHELTRTDSDRHFQVRRSTAETALSTTYDETEATDSTLSRVSTLPDGGGTSTILSPNGVEHYVSTDGTSERIERGPDPRWGMMSAVPVSTIIETPSGLTRTETAERSVLLSDTSNAMALDQLTITRRTGADAPSTDMYDAHLRQLHRISPQGRETLITYDALGRIARTDVPGFASQVLVYDTKGRMKTVSVGAGEDARTIAFHYRDDGYVGSLSGPPGIETTFLPDASGRPLQISDSEGKRVDLEYDLAGRLRSVTPSGRPKHEMGYTTVGLVESDLPAPTSPGATESGTHYTYDRERRIDLVTLPDGTSIDYQYDPQSGQLSRTLGSGSQTKFSYTPSGLVENIERTDSAGTHTLSMGYDGALATSETWSGDPGSVQGSIERAYDDHFRVSELRINGSTAVEYGYDQDNLLVMAGAMTISRRSDNGVLSGTTLGQTTTSETLTPFGELDESSASYLSNLLYDEHVTSHDKLSRIVERSETTNEGGELRTRGYHYEYDNSSRLADVFVNGEQVAHYDYGANGNRIGMVSAAGHVVGRYDDQDRLTRYCPEDANTDAQPMIGAPCFSYTYDPTGKLRSRTDILSGKVTWYQYDEFGALRAVELADGHSLQYEVDAAGRRVGKYVDGVKQWGLLYQSGLAPIAQLDEGNNVVSMFVYGTRANVPDYLIREGTVYRLVTDHSGSVRMVVNTVTGEIVEQVEYDEFGNVLADSNPGFQPFGFAGGLYDADTALVRFGARDYDPMIGRWTAKDPIVFLGGSTNLYAYVGSDPINLVDPSGLATLNFWPPEAGGYGHVSLTLDDGTYISYWPDGGPGGFSWWDSVPPALGRTYADDYLGEGRRNAWTIELDGLDEAKIKKWWNDGKGHGNFSATNNCSDTVLEALRRGGAKVPNPSLADPIGVLNIVMNLPEAGYPMSDLKGRGYIWGDAF